MELRHLRYFVGVAEELHFGRAATRLGISQPPLSQQIRLLEAELGVDLFERTSRRVRLTDAGTAFLGEARKTLEQADHAIATARRADRGEIGELAIGFITSAPLTPLLSKALFEFRNTHPAVHLDLAEMPRSMQIERLAGRTLDAGFIRGVEPPLLPPSLVASMVLEEDILVAMRADHRLAGVPAIGVADLAGEPFVLYDGNLGAGFNEPLTRLCRDAGFEPRVVQEVGGLATLLGLVAAGFGITVLARSLAALHLEDLVYRNLASPGAISRLWLIHHREMSPACRKLVDIVTGGDKARAARGR